MFGFDEDEDALFGGSPKKKYFDVIFNANRNLVEQALSDNLKRIAVLESLLTDRLQDGEDIDRLIQNYVVENMDEVEKDLIDAYITGMGDILTQNE
jgi:ribosome assembly protein YihI (activator of Der GTPase)